MDYSQYILTCPNCSTKITLVSAEVNPIILQCSGCNRVVVLHSNNLYTVSKEFLMELNETYNFSYCGQVSEVTIRRSDREDNSELSKKEPIGNEDIRVLHDFLEKAKDSLDIIKNM